MTRGRYCLKATLWLARRLREGYAPVAVRRAFLERRAWETGYMAADESRTFRAAVESAERVNDGRQGR